MPREENIQQQEVVGAYKPMIAIQSEDKAKSAHDVSIF